MRARERGRACDVYLKFFLASACVEITVKIDCDLEVVGAGRSSEVSDDVASSRHTHGKVRDHSSAVLEEFLRFDKSRSTHLADEGAAFVRD